MASKYEELSRTLNGNIESILRSWYPDGKVIGPNYAIGDASGSPGKSLNICIRGDNIGKWNDFEALVGGNDLISLYAKREGLSNSEALRALAKDYGEPDVQPGPAPTSAVAPPGILNASKYWQYTDATGNILCYVMRFDKDDGSKTFRQWSWDMLSETWIPKAYPAPRPLFNLVQISSNPDARILVVEGEKCVDAAESILNGKSIPTTWIGGASSVLKTDWTPLAGRTVTIWPDADKSGTGQKAANQIATRLTELSCKVNIIDVRKVSQDGWDIADAIAEGWDSTKIREFVKSNVISYSLNIYQQNNVSIITDSIEQVTAPGSMPQMWAEMGLQLIGRNGSPAPNLFNCERVINQQRFGVPDIWYDEFEETLCISDNGEEPRRLRDGDVSQITRVYFQGLMGITNMRISTVWEYLYEFETSRRRNWARTWIDNLKWDGIERIEGFLCRACGAENTEYHRRVSKFFLTSLAARMLSPGCQVDTMIVLEGKQGSGKSELLRALGGRIYKELSEGTFNEKELVIGMGGKAIIEFGELHALKQADINQLKNFITRRTDSVRGLFAKQHTDRPRHCVFTGTTNQDEYLADPTGARRFWPVKTTRMDTNYALTYRDQIFAEAAHYFKEHHTWHEMGEYALDEQEHRRVKDALEPRLIDKLVQHSKVSMHDLCFNILEFDEKTADWHMQRRIGQCMRAIGWERKVLGGSKVWVRKSAQQDEF